MGKNNILKIIIYIMALSHHFLALPLAPPILPRRAKTGP
jgi:hypothetical protein